MSMPAPAAGFFLAPDGLAALADELGLLATELAEDADAARSAAAVLFRALDGEAGWAAGAAATAWGSLEELLADRTRAVAATLRAAADAYRAEDVALAAGVGLHRRAVR
ncbi:MAG: hypothetical protein JWR45_1821 [Blastococcus sp.]|jgi:hypothetical protein|nr:hypothetical protein [Blastococcus sp.]